MMVGVEIGRRGNLARVRWVSADKLRIAVDFRNGQTGTIDATSEPFDLTEGTVVLIDHEGSKLDAIETNVWPEETSVAIVKLRNDAATILEIGGRLQIASVHQSVEFKQGNTVEVTDSGRVVRVLAEEPLRYLDVPSLDETALDKFRDTSLENLDLSFDDFGGYEEVKARAQELIETPLRYHEQLTKIGARPIKGVLFTGPPGTGKTMLAKIIAAQSDAIFYEISGPEIFSKWYGQSEELLRRLFEDAAKQPRAIIFFDEIDSVAGQRDEDAHEASKRVVAQLLTLMDRFDPEHNVVVIATTNRVEDIDVALRRPGRLDWEIDFPLPTMEDRLAILMASARRLDTDDPLPHDIVAGMTDKWSGAELAAIWSEAALLAVTDNRDSIMAEDYLGGLERVATQKRNLSARRRGGS